MADVDKRSIWFYRNIQGVDDLHSSAWRYAAMFVGRTSRGSLASVAAAAAVADAASCLLLLLSDR